MHTFEYYDDLNLINVSILDEYFVELSIWIFPLIPMRIFGCFRRHFIAYIDDIVFTVRTKKKKKSLGVAENIMKSSSQNGLYPFWSIWDICDWICWNIKNNKKIRDIFYHNSKNISL